MPTPTEPEHSRLSLGLLLHYLMNVVLQGRNYKLRGDEDNSAARNSAFPHSAPLNAESRKLSNRMKY